VRPNGRTDRLERLIDAIELDNLLPLAHHNTAVCMMERGAWVCENGGRGWERRRSGVQSARTVCQSGQKALQAADIGLRHEGNISQSSVRVYVTPVVDMSWSPCKMNVSGAP
jgi:hypothetical protein